MALVGIVIVTAMALLFVALFSLEAFGYLTNPYAGLLLYVAIPALFVIGLALIPIGIRLERRRHLRHPEAPHADWPVIDLRLAKQRTIIAVVVLLTIVNLILLSVASYGAVHYLETARFCGEVCHTTMEPQFAAYQDAPHARVPCVECHVGSGAEALVQTKVAGTRQLWHVVRGTVQKPVPFPVRTMRPARETCETCHWPEKFHGDELRVFREYGEDEKNTEETTALTMYVGGGSARLGIGTGIHWHMNLDNEVEYVTTDARREKIPYVRLRKRDGTIREYVVDGTTPEQLAAGERRRMDCLDCHNRPAHTFAPTPERAVNDAIAQGRIPRELPFVRREAVAAVRADYSDKSAAHQAIAARLREFYRSQPSADKQLVERAITATQDVWARNVFPAMRVTWGTYPNNLNHNDFPGCYRCHDDEHKAKDGSVIRQDCEICHSTP